MSSPSILVKEFFSDNLNIIGEIYKRWDYEKCLRLSEILIKELKNYSDVNLILDKAMIYKQLSLLEIFFKETTIK